MQKQTLYPKMRSCAISSGLVQLFSLCITILNYALLIQIHIAYAVSNIKRFNYVFQCCLLVHGESCFTGHFLPGPPPHPIMLKRFI